MRVLGLSLLAFQSLDASERGSVLFEGEELVDSTPHVVELYRAVSASAKETVVLHELQASYFALLRLDLQGGNGIPFVPASLSQVYM